MKNLDGNCDAILITGPTAGGKSALAQQLARDKGGVVVNADSMQVYDTLRVLTARPSDAEMEGVPHFLYGHVPASRLYSTGAWLRDIAALLSKLRQAGRLPVIVGGTGLYFEALTGGLSEMPAIAAEIRAHYRDRLRNEGAAALHEELQRRDKAAAETLKESDGQRIVRALEVMEATGRSIREFQRISGPIVVDPARAEKIVVLPERDLLHRRIEARFRQMMASGAVEEVRALLALDLPASHTAMKAIGVAQIAAMLAGRLGQGEATDRAAAATRQYAKRQMTWLRNRMGKDWRRVDPAAAP